MGEEEELDDEDEIIDPGHVPGADYDTPPKEVRVPLWYFFFFSSS